MRPSHALSVTPETVPEPRPVQQPGATPWGAGTGSGQAPCSASWLWVLVLVFAMIAQGRALGVIRDGGIDPANLGKGDWIYYTSMATNKLGGNVSSVTNEASLMLFYKSVGIRYILVKAATSDTLFNGSYSFPQFTSGFVNAAHAQGILVFGYNRSYGENIPGEIAIADYCFNRGADGFVYDAEAEWETRTSNPWITNGPLQAWQLAGTVRSNWPNKFIAYCSAAVISYHSTVPNKQFGYFCDAAMPMIYHYGWAARSPSGAINWTEVNWQNWQNDCALPANNPTTFAGTTVYWTNSIKPLAPVNHVYGPNPPNSGVSEIQPQDVVEFVDYLAASPHCVTAGGYKGASFWRADLHGAKQWTNIQAETSGDFPGIVSHLVLDDNRAAKSSGWTRVRTFYNGTFYGEGSGVDTNSFGTNYYYVAQGTGSVSATFRPTVVVGGDYNVYEWHVLRTNASAGVPFEIGYDGGTNTVYANQQTNDGNWSLLGRFNFAPGASGYIRVTDAVTGSGTVAILDGLKLVFVPPAGPVITGHPQSQTVVEGADALFTVAAGGTAPLYYQWRWCGTNLAGATGTSLSLTNVTTNQSGPYTVVVTNAAAVVTSQVATLTVNPTAPYGSLPVIWSLAPGSRPYLTTNSLPNERGMAYNAARDHLLVVSRSTPSVYVLDAATGADLYQLSVSGISGGTYPLLMIGAADDGMIYAGNLTSAGSTTPFTLYRWANDSSGTVPTVAFTGDPSPGNSQRYGDTFDVRGAGTNTQVLIGSRRGTNAVVLTTADGTNFTAKPVAVPGVPANSFGLGIAFGSGNTFWGKATGLPLRQVGFDLTAGTGSALLAYDDPVVPGAVAPIGVSTRLCLLAGISVGAANNHLRIYDLAPTLTNGAPVLIATNAFASDNDNATAGTGSVDFGSNTVYALCSNNGLLALRLTVSRPPTRMESILILPDQSVRLEMNGRPGGFALEVAPDVVNWTVLTNLTAPGTAFQYTDPSPAESSRYYRLRELP